ncbi:MFS transporter [Caloramator sp. E03]|uniref:MFS transporter n=1 Tax=Caloramator sp. E03 TaxID=2576307 RepID=UPI0011109AE5|nr:MFS transporter [Caloramator sp. E03]QCX34080.1 MFS transporter [Caloramator sp. E03]
MKSNKVKYNFGKQGIFMIFYSGLLVYFMTGLTVDGLNIIVPGFSALKGWNQNQLLSIATPASIGALILTSFWGFIVNKVGLKLATTIAMFASSISIFLFAHSINVYMYGIMETLMITFINCFSVICGYAMIANWFPKKKGIVLGFTTMGMNFASATIPALLTAFSKLIDKNGNIIHALNTFALIIFVLGILNQLFIKVTPEEAGVYPDNEPTDIECSDSSEAAISNNTRLGYLEALLSGKIWILGIAYGLAGMGTVGIMSQLIPYLSGNRGFTVERAILTMSIAAIIGVVGSYLWGVIDQKWGTKFASQVFGIWYAAGIAFLIAPGGKTTLMIGIFMIGIGIGGTGNFPPSMTTLCYGRYDFATAFSVVNMIMGVIRSAAFVVLGLVRGATGSTETAYMVFLVLSILSSVMISFAKTEEDVAVQLKSNSMNLEVNKEIS